MMAKAKHDISVIFFSRFGWFGLTWVDEDVRQLVFAQPGRKAAAMALQTTPEGGRLTARQLELVSRLKRFADGQPLDFSDVSVDLSGRTAFQQLILQHCRNIPWGTTSTYGQLARAAGRPSAARAVGMAMARNPIPIIIPCHRVIPAHRRDGGGFSARGGNSLKQKLLAQEGIPRFSAR